MITPPAPINIKTGVVSGNDAPQPELSCSGTGSATRCAEYTEAVEPKVKSNYQHWGLSKQTIITQKKHLSSSRFRPCYCDLVVGHQGRPNLATSG